MMKRNRYYSFNTLAPGVLGTSFTNVKLASILDYRDALAKRNVIQIQAAIISMLGKQDRSLEDYDYYAFRTSASEELILADAWIDMSTVVETFSQNAVITIMNTDVISLGTLRNLMSALGMQYTIVVSTTSPVITN